MISKKERSFEYAFSASISASQHLELLCQMLETVNLAEAVLVDQLDENADNNAA